MAGTQEAASLTGKHTGEAGPHITAEELQMEQGPGEVRLGISVAGKSPRTHTQDDSTTNLLSVHFTGPPCPQPSRVSGNIPSGLASGSGPHAAGGGTTFSNPEIKCVSRGKGLILESGPVVEKLTLWV